MKEFIVGFTIAFGLLFLCDYIAIRFSSGDNAQKIVACKTMLEQARNNKLLYIFGSGMLNGCFDYLVHAGE